MAFTKLFVEICSQVELSFFGKLGVFLLKFGLISFEVVINYELMLAVPLQLVANIIRLLYLIVDSIMACFEFSQSFVDGLQLTFLEDKFVLSWVVVVSIFE